MAEFAHLRLHTEYSLIDSVVRVPELVDAVAGSGMNAVAVTDQNIGQCRFDKLRRHIGLRGITLAIQIDQQGLKPANSQPGCQITRSRRLTDATFLVGD